jgi:hypothetical protein
VEAYGPTVQLSPTSGPKGSSSAVLFGSGNFAANATVAVTFGNDDKPIGTGVTDVAGALAATLVFIVPETAPAGPVRVTIVDNRSAYPAYATFTVTN